MILRSKLFFIGHSNRFNQDGQPIWSFYSKDLNAPLEELTEGVEHWHLEPVFAEKESLRVTGIHATIWVDSVDATSADVKMVSKNGRTYQDRLTHFVGEYFWALQSFA